MLASNPEQAANLLFAQATQPPTLSRMDELSSYALKRK